MANKLEYRVTDYCADSAHLSGPADAIAVVAMLEQPDGSMVSYSSGFQDGKLMDANQLFRAWSLMTAQLERDLRPHEVRHSIVSQAIGRVRSEILGIGQEAKTNKKNLTMWQEIVDRKAEWIGGTLTVFGDRMDRALFDGYPVKGIIRNIELDAITGFSVTSDEFTCSGNVRYLGLTGDKREGIDLLFSGYAGHEWGITKPDKT